MSIPQHPNPTPQYNLNAYLFFVEFRLGLSWLLIALTFVIETSCLVMLLLPQSAYTNIYNLSTRNGKISAPSTPVVVKKSPGLDFTSKELRNKFLTNYKAINVRSKSHKRIHWSQKKNLNIWSYMFSLLQLLKSWITGEFGKNVLLLLNTWTWTIPLQCPVEVGGGELTMKINEEYSQNILP